MACEFCGCDVPGAHWGYCQRDTRLMQLTTERDQLRAEVERLLYGANLSTVAFRKLCEERDSLRAAVERAEAALRDIVDPMARLRRDAEASGLVVNAMAGEVVRDAGYLQAIARSALNGTDGGEADHG